MRSDQRLGLGDRVSLDDLVDLDVHRPTQSYIGLCEVFSPLPGMAKISR